MRNSRIRYLAAAAAAGSAVLYYLIGLGVLDIGEARSGEPPDLLGFGLIAGTTFAFAAVVVLVVNRRWIWALVALLDLAVIIGYFAMGDIRVPSYEFWGLLVKAFQLALLVMLAVLVLRAPRTGQARRLAGRNGGPA